MSYDYDRLLKASRALALKMEQVTEDTQGIFVLAHVHGQGYTGATYGEELEELKAVIKDIDDKSTV